MIQARSLRLVAIATACLVFAGGCVGEFDELDENEEANDTKESEVDERFADLPDRPWNSLEDGPFEVGYRYDSFEYTPLGEGEEARPIDLSIWYPTFEDDGDHARYSGLIQQEGIWEDAAPALDGPAPVMLFSHGNSGMSTQNYFSSEHLASHGWIVVAPEHTGNTWMGSSDHSINMSKGFYRPQDMSASLDYFLDLPDDDPLADSASDDIAISGHSFGGFTSLANTGASFAVDELQEECESGNNQEDYCDLLTDENEEIFRDGFLDERIKVSLPMTPGGADVFRQGLADVAVPTLVWTAAEDATLPNVVEGDPIWEGLSGDDHVRIDMLEAGHFTYSNMCDLVGTAIPQAADDGCSDEFIVAKDVHPLINAYTLEFLRLHLFEDEDAADWFSPDHEPLHENFIFSFK